MPVRGRAAGRTVYPRGRPGLIVRRVGAELVVYDPESHAAHCLNRTAAIVLRRADGRTSVAGLAAVLAAETGTRADEAVVRSAIEQLADAGLIARSSRPASASRRRALRQVGLGVAALAPIVVSLVVPSPTEAAATCIPAASCNSSNFGQPCFVLSTAECASKTCTGLPSDCQ
jgi:PqqD family protein of HPr-rel-A system